MELYLFPWWVISNVLDQAGDKSLQNILPLPASFYYFFMVGDNFFIICGHTFVSDKAERKDSHATVTSHNDLMDGAHTC